MSYRIDQDGTIIKDNSTVGKSGSGYSIDKDGTIVRDESAALADKVEREKIAETSFWNRCQTREDIKRYLRKYPNGIYVSNAESILAQRTEEGKKEDKTAIIFRVLFVVLELTGVVMVVIMSNSFWSIGDWIANIVHALFAAFLLDGLIATVYLKIVDRKSNTIEDKSKTGTK